MIQVPDRPSDPPEELAPEIVCPFCGAIAEYFYVQEHEIIGCCECVAEKHWQEIEE